jgi:hypothetical protein
MNNTFVFAHCNNCSAIIKSIKWNTFHWKCIKLSYCTCYCRKI